MRAVAVSSAHVVAWTRAVLLLVAAAAFIPPASLVSPVAAAEQKLIDFEMEDQFKNAHRREDYEGRVVVLIGSDKHGSDFNALWSTAIRDSLGEMPGYEEIAFLPAADVRGVPRFMKRFVRGKFPKEPEKWALVDWDGKFAKAYDWRPEVANLVVFSPDGERVMHAFGKEPHPEAIGAVVAALRAYLESAAREGPEEADGAPAEKAPSESPAQTP